MITYLIIVGVVCIGLEFVIPGLGISGLIGVISLLWAWFIYLGANAFALAVVAGATLCGIALLWALIKLFPNTSLGKALTLSLRSTSDKGYTSVDTRADLLGQRGKTLTALRPAGVVQFDKQHLDVVAEGGFIEVGTEVVVISVTGGRIVVRPVLADDINN